METERYTQLKDHINKRVTIDVIFQKYGKTHGQTTKSTCLKNIKIGDTTIDHIWVKSKALNDAKLRTNQPIRIETTIRKRSRPSERLFDEPTMDIQLLKIAILTKGRRW